MVDTIKKFIVDHFLTDRDLYKLGWVFREDGWILKYPVELEINRRVADIISKMDPFEPLLKEYHGIFSDEFEKVEESLDDRSKLEMYMWGYRQYKDPCHTRMINWVMDNAGNRTMKDAPISAERTQYGRAQIANMILFRREIRRLALLYEEKLHEGRQDGFDENLPVE